MDKELLKKLPKVDYLLNHKELTEYGRKTDYYTFSESIKSGVDFFRKKILEEDECCTDINEEKIIEKIKEILKIKSSYSLKKIINGTGTIIHTNFGRCIFPEKTAEHLFEIATSYSNLEYDIEKGERGSRYSHLEKLICEVTGAEGALAVNNNAAAVVLCLNEFAKGREVLISRGELVEIGGSFRIPDIMRFAGAELKEVGTTNKTYTDDYKKAVNEKTAMILKVHASNYKICGFTKEADREELSDLAKERELVSMEDLGSGAVIDFSKYGLKKETTVQEVLKSGIDLVAFSGDKLFGGCQAGIIAGKKELIERLKKNQYLRTVRIDKMTVAVLEAVFRLYRDEREAVKNIPVLKMITENIFEVKKRAEKFSKILSERKINHKIIETEANIGGGAMPEETIKSFGIELLTKFSPEKTEEMLRKADTAVIGRIFRGRYILDMKTVREKEIYLLGNIISELLGENKI